MPDAKGSPVIGHDGRDREVGEEACSCGASRPNKRQQRRAVQHVMRCGTIASVSEAYATVLGHDGHAVIGRELVSSGRNSTLRFVRDMPGYVGGFKAEVKYYFEMPLEELADCVVWAVYQLHRWRRLCFGLERLQRNRAANREASILGLMQRQCAMTCRRCG